MAVHCVGHARYLQFFGRTILIMLTSKQEGWFIIHQECKKEQKEQTFKKEKTQQNFANCNIKWRKQTYSGEEEPLPIFKISPKCNPGIMLGPKAARNEKVFNKIDELLALWKAFWYHGIEKKNIPRFSVLVAKLFEKTDAKTYTFNISKIYYWL